MENTSKDIYKVDETPKITETSESEHNQSKKFNVNLNNIEV
jgi:hypothetical protein